MSSKAPIPEAIFDQAERWVVRASADDFSGDEEKRLKAWLCEHPNHRRAFDATAAIWEGIGHIDPVDQVQHIEFADTLDHRIAAPRRWLPVAAAVAALVILAVAATLNPLAIFDDNTYRTAAGARLSVSLRDGSLVHLNTRTRLEVDFSERARKVALEDGEAYFEVTPDPQRPFVVAAGDTTVRVVGTRFSVYRRPDGDVTVTVIKGKVEVERAGDQTAVPQRLTLMDGEQVSYHDGRVADPVRRVDAEEAVSWRRGVLVFKDKPLAEVVAELNRYSQTPIVIADKARFDDVRVGGVISIESIPAALEFLEMTAPVSVSQRDGRYEITPTIRG